ncbi:sugar phosphate isomerase/epimerase family protein [Paenibacillus ihumii]|uniref:sugar phosphate isomerase/epimerase family protein n=1 Tax=Paenibacillus ihumii TaxID=687436 RepID=UPI0006D7BE98|nr:sugar phosphate isomerase/epimerase family protein [Paenibacillus ihumii]
MNNPLTLFDARRASLQFSICTTGLRGMAIEDIAAEASRLGLQGLEIWSGHIRDYLNRGGTLSMLRTVLEASRLQVPCISEYSCFTKGEEVSPGELDDLRQSAEWARALNCPRIRVFAGHMPSRQAESEHWSMAATGLREALQICRGQGVALAVEIHNNTLADTADSLGRLLQDSRLPKKGQAPAEAAEVTEVELIYDPFNLYVDRLDPIPVLERYYPFVSHVHFKDYRWNHEDWGRSEAVPVLQGDAGHAAILERLLSLGYRGFISLEYFGDRALELAEQSLAELIEYVHKRIINPD